MILNAEIYLHGKIQAMVSSFFTLLKDGFKMYHHAVWNIQENAFSKCFSDSHFGDRHVSPPLKSDSGVIWILVKIT